MNYQTTIFDGLIVLEPEVFKDSRGRFEESYNQSKFEKIIKEKINFCQDNQSISKKNVLRGLHYQEHPFEQSKLIKVIHGSICDVVVDLRKKSNTFGQHFKIVLSKENNLQLFIPKGFAHGFLSLEEETVVSYKVDNFYNQKSEKCILFDDPTLKINWEIEKNKIIISEKDRLGISFFEYNAKE